MPKAVRFALLTMALIWPILDACAEQITVKPDGKWREAINQAQPGDEIILSPGRYIAPCVIRASGTPDAPIRIRASSEEEGKRSIFAYEGTTSNAVEFADGTAYVEIRGLFWASTRSGVDAIKLRQNHHLLIENCVFENIGGIAISANSGDTHHITIRNNTFRNLQATGLYFGRHDGTGSHATSILIEGNQIQHVRSDAVGYGIQIKLNSSAIIRNNRINDTKGPGIMIYGSNRGDPPSIIYGNQVAGSLNDGAIVVGGGSVVICSNMATGGSAGGIVAQDYQNRGLMANIWIVRNTLRENRGPAIKVQGFHHSAANVIACNTITPSATGGAFEPLKPEAIMWGNKESSHERAANSLHRFVSPAR